MEVVRYIGGITSVLWEEGSSHCTEQPPQYCGCCSVQWGITSVHAGDKISTVGVNISTVKGIQYSGRIPSVPWRTTSVLWRLLSTVEIKI